MVTTYVVIFKLNWMKITNIAEHKRTEQADSSEEDAGIDMTLDNCSETSLQSDLKSNHEEPGKNT